MDLDYARTLGFVLVDEDEDVEQEEEEESGGDGTTAAGQTVTDPAAEDQDDDETFMEYDITANHHDTSPPPRQSTPAHDMDSSPVAIHDDETISIEGSPHDDTISCEDGESSVPRAGMLTDENFNPMVRQLQDMGFEKTQAEASLALNSCLETAIQHLIVANQDKPSPPLEEDLLRANISSLNLVESRRTVTNGDCWYHFNIC